MATAGERYEERTGNAWSYANRGDMTGLKAALARGVDVNIINTVGWTPCHAAAAGGQNKALRLLVKAGADLSIVDRGGDTPAHEAAKNGHVHALVVLQELGADITRVRLSQCKGKATRDLLADACRKAGRTALLEGDDIYVPVVGYARKQSKSTAFWGPRRTPISCKIKKKIIKDRRQRKGEKSESLHMVEDKDSDEGPDTIAAKNEDGGADVAENENELSYVETVRQIKRNKKQKRRQKQARKTDQQQCDLHVPVPQPTRKSDLGSEFVKAVAKEQAEGTITESSDDEHAGISEDEDDACEDDDTGGGLRLFADLMLFDGSDSE
mmetsp:Transcript_13177/g.23898  ORF Transcript_13177/g.23898 Transcript_13177/m.23898 type:complete len:325 (-) Transcript_13177:559-1533(-)|eukprot:CAMPEP_0198295586 /NCGR_PEP_ID=MMETSP1449-20131203/28411_1 /TAXON_ID=420275 /ORGANISM="Attheya septentrionalis, Strain CCMP2084" /LENGTH=324 /DNA_ID=CAMNT_0043995939 /DNA_START=132 /DNA_END=1106 /DNA_ORIENTATION=+